MSQNPILKEIADLIHGERVLLRCPAEGDGISVHEGVVESLAELRAWPASLPWALQEPSPEASEIFCRMSRAEFIQRKRLPYLVIDRATSRFIGGIGVNRMDWDVPRFEIGFWCRSGCHGQGLMTDALSTLVSYLRTTHGARRVECYTDEENMKARRLCERVGMLHEATLRNERANPDGSLRHTVAYSIVG